MAITREIDLTWQGASKPFAPTITSIVRIENAVRKATERPDFSIADALMRLDKDPVMFAVVWGSMLHLAGHDRADDVNDADAVDWWYQQAWQAMTQAAEDKLAMQDLSAARDVLFQMVAPSVDLGKPAAPRAQPSGGAKKTKSRSR